MGLMMSVYNLFCGKKLTAAQRARVNYLTRVSRFSILEASLPVFIAAGISNAAGAIIEAISDEHEGLDIEIIQFAVYSMCVYVVGKYLTYLMLTDEQFNSNHSVFQFIRQYKLSKLIRHVTSENSGFAFKELFIIIILNTIYNEHGWGPAFGGWLLSIVFFVALVYVSSYVQRILCGVSWDMNAKLLSFDSDGAGLPVAFVLTVLLALGMRGLHAGFVSESSYLYSWDEDYEDSVYGSDGVGLDLYILYASAVSLVAATLLAVQEEDEESGAERRPSAPPSPSMDLEIDMSGGEGAVASGNRGGKRSGVDPSASAAIWEMWIAFLGYLCGVAWFVVVIDNIKLGFIASSMSELVSSFLGVLLVAVLVTYKGPSCMVSARIKQDVIERKRRALLLDRKRATAATSGTVGTRGDGSSASAPPEAAAVKDGSCCSWTGSACQAVYEFYLRVNFNRKEAAIVSFRLIIGWSWEIVVQQVFELLGASEHDSLGVETLVQCVLAVVVVALSLVVHLYIRDWDVALQGEEEAAAEAAREDDPALRALQEQQQQQANDTPTASTLRTPPAVNTMQRDNDITSPLFSSNHTR